MAKRIIHQLIDDIDGSVLEPGAGQTVSFALDGRQYEIDLTDDHAAEFREKVATYIESARRASETTDNRSRRSAPQKPAHNHDLAAIRAWARDKGHTVSDRGRVSQAIIAEYYAKTGATLTTVAAQA